MLNNSGTLPSRTISPLLQTTLYAIVGVVSLVFNILIVLGILRNRGMRTRSNYLLVNLAFNDIGIILFGIPLTIYNLNTSTISHLRGGYCDLTGYLILLMFVASNVNLTWIALHRYLLLVQSSFYTQHMTTKRVMFGVFICWALTGLISLAPVLGWSRMAYNFGRAHCMIVWEDNLGYLIFLQLIAFTIPLCIMIFSYYNVITKTKQSRKRFQSVADEANVLRKALEQKLTLMFLVVVIVFFTCFMPYAVMIWTEGFFQIKTSELYNFVAMIMCYSNSMCEFWIYFTMSRKFRLAVRSLFVSFTNEHIPTSMFRSTADVESSYI